MQSGGDELGTELYQIDSNLSASAREGIEGVEVDVRSNRGNDSLHAVSISSGTTLIMIIITITIIIKRDNLTDNSPKLQ